VQYQAGEAEEEVGADEKNIMFVPPGVTRSVLLHFQVRKFCEAEFP